ncbi:hypothetical protein TrST_g6454 [Triparma strigata]|uniref:Uncharacterized protein n=1 Tax=Triparma strigata TaxID=1606541 RepID=A0A9W6ZNK0_9STRA|nr:hypothetical protein TrST_g6454 [Triparma strigata]
MPASAPSPADAKKFASSHKGKRNSEKLTLTGLRQLHTDSFYKPSEKQQQKFNQRMTTAQSSAVQPEKDGEGNSSFDATRDLHKKFLALEDDSTDYHRPLKTVPQDDPDMDHHVVHHERPSQHLRPRSMTARVAHLLHHSQATGKVLDLNKSHNKLHSFLEDVNGEDPLELVDAEGQFKGMTNWMPNAQNPSGMKRVMNEEFPYYALSEKKETLNMRAAEALQRSEGDEFWGLIKTKREEEENTALMTKEDTYASEWRDAEKVAMLHQKWKELDKQSKLNHEISKAKKEEKARKSYMKMFMTATDSSAIIGHKWATRPTVIMRSSLISPVSPSHSAQIVEKPSAVSPTGAAKGAGYKIEITPSVPTTTTIPIVDGKKKKMKAPADNMSAIFGSDSISGAKSISFHASSSRIRTKKINSFQAEKDHYAQEPFERFAAMKVRPASTTTLKSSASDPSLPRPKLADRLPLDTYLNATPLKSSSRQRTGGASSRPTPSVQQDAGESHEVNMGLFHGVTVAGGGKRLSVMAPVIPKTERQLERDRFIEAFQYLFTLDSTAALRQTVFLEDLMEGLKSDKKLKHLFMGTIFWPTLKGKKWDEINKGLREFISEGEAISFDGFYEYTRTLYHESGVANSMIRKLNDNSLRSGKNSLRVGDKIEARAKGQPYWLPGTITRVGAAETGDYKTCDVKYELVMAWRKVQAIGVGVGDGVDIFKKTAEDKVVGGVVLEHGADDEDESSVEEAKGEARTEEEVDPSASGLDQLTIERLIDLNPLGEEAASKCTSEAEVLEFVFALIRENSDVDDAPFNKVIKSEVLEAVQQCVSEGEDGMGDGVGDGDSNGDDRGSLGGYAMQLEGEESSRLLKNMIRKSSALLSLGEMERVKEAFVNVGEDKTDIVNVIHDGARLTDDGKEVTRDDYQDTEAPVDIGKDAFVEFFLTISDILQFNNINF